MNVPRVVLPAADRLGQGAVVERARQGGSSEPPLGLAVLLVLGAQRRHGGDSDTSAGATSHHTPAAGQVGVRDGRRPR